MKGLSVVGCRWGIRGGGSRTALLIHKDEQDIWNFVRVDQCVYPDFVELSLFGTET